VPDAAVLKLFVAERLKTAGGRIHNINMLYGKTALIFWEGALLGAAWVQSQVAIDGARNPPNRKSGLRTFCKIVYQIGIPSPFFSENWL
jgi:hypothetical protein